MFLVINLAIVAFASDSTESEAKFVEKVRSGIATLGTGPEAKIQVKLKDGTKLKGYIREADDKQFVVVDSQSNATPVPYPMAKQVKGNNLSKGTIFIIGLVGFLVVLILVGLRGS